MDQLPGPNCLKIFTSIIYILSKSICFKPFQSSLMFVKRAGAYPSEVPLKVLYSRAGFQPFLNTLD
jgi:hypothetical protein